MREAEELATVVRSERRGATNLVCLVEDREGPFVFGLGRVLKVLDVGTDDLAVGDEEALCTKGEIVSEGNEASRRERRTRLSVDHVRNHHDLVRLLVRELERRLGRLDIEGHDDGLGTTDTLLDERDGDLAVVGRDLVPESDSDVYAEGSQLRREE